MRTDGSLMKAPGVVCRPIQSISWRSTIRSGETVFVPIGSSLTRCGISEPVTKTVCSSTFCLRFGACSTLGSASTVPANQLVATRIATLEDIEVLTTEPTPSWVLRANCRNEDKPSLQKQERQWLLAIASQTQPKLQRQNLFVRRA